MAKRRPGSADIPTWVPSGLKVRGAATSGSQGAPEAVNVPADQQEPPTGIVPQPDHLPNPDIADRSVDHLRRSTDRVPVDASSAAPPLPTPLATNEVGFRPLPVLTILTLICLGILVWLGQWQWVKFVEKSKAPDAMTAIVPTSVTAALESASPDYKPVIVEGLIDPRAVKVSVVQGGVRGYRLFSPVVLEAGGIFVDRGFVSEEDALRVKPPTGQVRLTGVLRKGAKPNRYTPDNDPASDVWYWPDITAMSDILVIQTSSAQYYVALSQVDPLATGKTIVNPYADRKGANQVEPERHLGYALTWWGFGLALIGVYIGLHVRMGRLRFRRSVSS